MRNHRRPPNCYHVGRVAGDRIRLQYAKFFGVPSLTVKLSCREHFERNGTSGDES